jgi:hypothetical protein
MCLPASPLLRLVLSLCILAGSVPRVVLCLGSDGHRAIESLDASCCGGATSSAGMASRCSRTCTDLPLSLGVGVRESERGGLNINRPATPVPGDIATSPAACVLTRLGGGAASPRPLAHHPRSIVLLC